MFYLAFIVLLSSALELLHIPPSKIGPSPRRLSSLAFNDQNRTLYLYGGQNSVFYDDLWSYSLDSENWEILNTFSITPGIFYSGQRHSSSTFFRPRNSELCIYGGKGDKNLFSDLWCYRMATMSWEHRKTANPPGAFYKYACLYFENLSKEYFAVAGINIFTSEYQIFILDLQTWKWNEIYSEYDKLVTRMDFDLSQVFVFVAYDNGTLMFPVLNKNSPSQDIFFYNVADKEIRKAKSYFDGHVASLSNPVGLMFLNRTFIIVFESELVLHCDLSYPNLIWRFSAVPFLIPIQSAVLCYDNYCYTFGGSISTELTNSLSKWTFMDVFNSTSQMLASKYISPSLRFSHSMEILHGELILFGGKDKDKFFNDIWRYNIKKDTWIPLSPEGNPPTPRADFSSYIAGDAYIVWGGEDESGLTNDLFIYNCFSNIWNTISTSSLIIPSKRKSACIYAQMPLIYIFGGIDNTGPCSDLWMFDFTDKSYTKLKDLEAVKNPHCLITNDKFSIINENSITSIHLKTLEKTSSSFSMPKHSIFIPLDTFWVSIGGFLTSQGPYMPILKSYFLENQIILDLKESFYKSAAVYYNKSVYFFGGLALTPTHWQFPYNFPKALFAKLDLSSLCDDYKCNVPCSKGFYKQSHSCGLCPEGTYGENQDNVECELCKPGFFNPYQGGTSHKQCYPCPEGTFSNKPSAKMCKICSPDDFCPVASASPIKNSQSFKPQRVKSEALRFGEAYKVDCLWYFLYALCGLVGFVGACWVFLPKLREKISKIDIFTQHHACEEGNYVKITRNTLGGLVTLLYIWVVFTTTGIIICHFFLKDHESTLSLIPTDLLQGKYPNIDFQIEVKLLNYPGFCIHKIEEFVSKDYEGKCSDDIKIITNGVNKKFDDLKCKIEYRNTCQIVYKCMDCYIGKNTELSFSISENNSYATGIVVNGTFDLDGNGGKSIVVSDIQAGKGKVFIGSEESVFNLLMTPMYYYGETADDIGYKGYYVVQNVTPKSGSQNSVENMSFNFHIGLKILLSKTLNALVTFQKERKSVIIIISIILGVLAGVFNFFALTLSHFEHWRSQKKRQSIQPRNFNRIISQSEALSEMHFHEMFSDSSVRSEDYLNQNK
ncbi:hypothetical protein SteCoe_36618 [Stentor coeruleus]|uniref:Tyrosine-protein kinase ephrin type A/B receptor-like domain-containing protein n=1 Tax=Stentor coeruleus TaxID=5963 RepID=A0A1R2APV9_9CILI|nr:hypothetical protein SteCoe_36618 [Stentor coeruleus]